MQLPFEDVSFPNRMDRPYAAIDMVATIDGKTVSGEPGENVSDLGSQVDHYALKGLLGKVDAVLIGAGTLRATPKTWNPGTRYRIVVTNSGRVDYRHAFFRGGEGLVATSNSDLQPAIGVEVIRAGLGEFDPNGLARELKRRGINSLLILGGSETNALFLSADLVDELFLTLAPKIKLGRNMPTYAGGRPLDRQNLLKFRLVSSQQVGDEMYLRYRRVEGS